MTRKSVKQRPSEEPLPDTWTWISPDEMADDSPYSIGIGPFGSNLLKSDYQEAGVRLVFVKNIRSEDFSNSNSRYVTAEKAAELHQHAISGGELLITKMGDPPGDVAVYPKDAGPAVITSDCIKVKVAPEISSEVFLARAIRSPMVKRQIVDITTGVAHQKVSLDRFRQVAIPLPPLPEQRRIVAKLERLSARSSAARAHLSRTTKLAARAKQAVLRAAFEGHLTSEWSSGRLMEAIAAEISGIDGRVPKLAELPSSWAWKSVDRIALVTGGLTKNQSRSSMAATAPYLRVANVYANELRLSDIAEIGCTEGERSRALLLSGDLLVVEGNGSQDQIGRVAMWRGEVEGCLHQNHLIRVRPQAAQDGLYLLYWLLSPDGREAIEAVASSSSGLHTLSISKVKGLPVPVCPVEERQEIVRRIEAAFARIDRLTEEATRAAHLLDRLDERLLAKAFRGELVPQDPADEPAEALLARIRAARETAPRARRGGRRTT